MGLTFIKFDVGHARPARAYVEDGVVGSPLGEHDLRTGRRYRARGTVGTQLTDRGIARFVEIVSAVREAVGWEMPLAVDHFGPLTVNDAIRLGPCPGALRPGLDGGHHALVGHRGQSAGHPGHQRAHAQLARTSTSGTVCAR